MKEAEEEDSGMADEEEIEEEDDEEEVAIGRREAGERESESESESELENTRRRIQKRWKSDMRSWNEWRMSWSSRGNSTKAQKRRL